MQLSPEQFINLSDIATVFLSNNTPVSDVIDTQMMGKRLKKARERKGLTLKELASQTGLIWSHIHGLEKGRNIPSLKTLAKITTALGTTPDVILAKNLPTSKTFLYEEFMEKFQQLSKPEQQIMAKIIAFQIDELESEK